MSDTLLGYAENAVARAKSEGLKIAVAESCTGGLIAAALTAVPGASEAFDRGFVTYSDESKTEMLGVAAALIATHGAVSAEVAEAMAEGARKRSNADLAVAVTGIAGPSGGTKEKPVGLVYIAAASEEKAAVEKHVFPGDRAAVREAAARRALELFSLFSA